MQFVRMIMALLVIETIFYLMISVYIRSLRTEALEKEWMRRHPERAGDRPAMQKFVEHSMAGFRKTLKARLVGIVFVIPTLIVVGIVIAVNG